MRDVMDLLDEIVTNKEVFKDNHNELIVITKTFIKYYIENSVDLLQIMHSSESHIEQEEEEEWKTDDEGECVENSTQSNPLPLETINNIEDEIPWIEKEVQWNNPTELEMEQQEIVSSWRSKNTLKISLFNQMKILKRQKFCNTTSAMLRLFYYFNKQTRKV